MPPACAMRQEAQCQVRVGGTFVFPKRCFPTRLGASVCRGFNFIPTYSFDKCRLNYPNVWALESRLEGGIRRLRIPQPRTGLAGPLKPAEKDTGSPDSPVTAPFLSFSAHSLLLLIFSPFPLATTLMLPAHTIHWENSFPIVQPSHRLLITQTATPGIRGSTFLVPHFPASMAAGREILWPLLQRLLRLSPCWLPPPPTFSPTLNHPDPHQGTPFSTPSQSSGQAAL